MSTETTKIRKSSLLCACRATAKLSSTQKTQVIIIANATQMKSSYVKCVDWISKRYKNCTDIRRGALIEVVGRREDDEIILKATKV